MTIFAIESSIEITGGDMIKITKAQITDVIMNHILLGVRAQGYVGIPDAEQVQRSYMRLTKTKLLRELAIQEQNTKLRLGRKIQLAVKG